MKTVRVHCWDRVRAIPLLAHCGREILVNPLASSEKSPEPRLPVSEYLAYTATVDV